MRNFSPKQIVVIVGFGIALLVLLGIVSLASKAGKTLVTFEFAPSLAEASVDKRSVHSGKVYVSKGKHQLVVRLQNFSTTTQTIEVGDQDMNVSVSLNPSNDAGRKLLISSPQYQLEREAVGGQSKESLNTLKTTPLTALLPAVSIRDAYRIEYGDSSTRPGQTVIIITDSSPDGRQNALRWIRSKGFDPTQLEIEYRDFANPFTFRYITQEGTDVPISG